MRLVIIGLPTQHLLVAYRLPRPSDICFVEPWHHKSALITPDGPSAGPFRSHYVSIPIHYHHRCSPVFSPPTRSLSLPAVYPFSGRHLNLPLPFIPGDALASHLRRSEVFQLLNSCLCLTCLLDTQLQLLFTILFHRDHFTLPPFIAVDHAYDDSLWRDVCDEQK